MSQPELADQLAAQAVVRHHSELAATLSELVTQLVEAAGTDAPARVWELREDLTSWLHDELLPHAYAEEAALYPAAAELPAGKLLIDGMLAEHRVIAALVADLAAAASPVTAAATAHALRAVFASHLAKENDLVVPLLVAADGVSLAGLLDGLHDIIGADADAAPGGCGCGGCGCGGDTAAATGPAAHSAAHAGRT